VSLSGCFGFPVVAASVPLIWAGITRNSMIGRDADPTGLMKSKLPMAMLWFKILNPQDYE
jgi:hypothetical protein